MLVIRILHNCKTSQLFTELKDYFLGTTLNLPLIKEFSNITSDLIKTEELEVAMKNKISCLDSTENSVLINFKYLYFLFISELFLHVWQAVCGGFLHWLWFHPILRTLPHFLLSNLNFMPSKVWMIWPTILMVSFTEQRKEALR